MAKTKLEILEIYDGEIIDMNQKVKKKKWTFFDTIFHCFVSTFPKVE